MIRQDLIKLENWTLNSARGKNPREYTFSISESCPPAAKRIWAEMQFDEDLVADQRWGARLQQESLDGTVSTLPSDSQEDEIYGSTFRQVAADLVLEFEGYVDDLKGAVNHLSSLLDPPILTVTDVAQELRTPRNTVLHWIKMGKLRAFRVGKKWQIRREDLVDALEKAAGPDTPHGE